MNRSKSFHPGLIPDKRLHVWVSSNSQLAFGTSFLPRRNHETWDDWVLILFTLFNDVRERRKEYTVFKKDELYLHDL